MKKADKWDLPDPWAIDLRRWQEQAFKAYLSSEKENFLANATPGAGKTIFGLRIAHHELTSGLAIRILIVTPSENLRSQWAKEAARVGINLSTDYNAMFDLASDYHGVVTTYQTIAARHGKPAEAFRKYTGILPTLGILDEVHHVGESLSWANGLVEAMEPCVRRLIITGTPFRSDNNPIPFVTYKIATDGGRECVPDYTYGYEHALRDRVVRPVYFQTFNGDVSWFTPEGEMMQVRMDEKISQALAAQRLRMTIDHRGDWLRSVLIDAHAKLLEIRKEDPTAGGLVITKDVMHANKVAKVLEDVTREKPVVVTSEQIGASNEIERFRYSQDKWIVAVKMVSEGVDIKRLRVSVWATNIQTELFFRQVVGRLVRITEQPEDQYAHQYIPELEPLTTYASQMKQERAHAIDDLDSIADELEDLEKETGGPRIDSLFAEFLSSTGEKSLLIHDASSYTPQETSAACEELHSVGLAVTDATMVAAIKLMRKWGRSYASQPSATPNHTNGKPPKTLEEKKKELRDVIKRMVKPICEASNWAIDYQYINRQLNESQSVKKIDECTFDQLKERREILSAWLEAWRNGTGRQFTVKGYIHQRVSTVFS